MNIKSYILSILREGLENAKCVDNQLPYIELINIIKTDEIDCNFEPAEGESDSFILTEKHIDYISKIAEYCQNNPLPSFKSTEPPVHFNNQLLIIRSINQAWLRTRNVEGNWPSWSNDHMISISSASLYETDLSVERLEHKPEHQY